MLPASKQQRLMRALHELIIIGSETYDYSSNVIYRGLNTWFES